MNIKRSDVWVCKSTQQRTWHMWSYYAIKSGWYLFLNDLPDMAQLILFRCVCLFLISIPEVGPEPNVMLSRCCFHIILLILFFFCISSALACSSQKQSVLRSFGFFILQMLFLEKNVNLAHMGGLNNHKIL